MEAKLYYTPPERKYFDEVKIEAVRIWSTMGDEPRYPLDKIERVIHLDNIGDNFMVMVAMFDPNNQLRLSLAISQEAREQIRLRMIDGGTPEEYIPF